MKALLALSVLLAVAGCALEPADQVARAECKIAPITTRNVATGTRTPEAPDRLEQREAQMRLASTSYRHTQLARFGGPDGNLLEEALRDCDRALAK
jgi:hypothetical protein